MFLGLFPLQVLSSCHGLQLFIFTNGSWWMYNLRRIILGSIAGIRSKQNPQNCFSLAIAGIAGWKSPAPASDLVTGVPISPSLWSSTAKIGTWCCTRFAYHLLSFGHQILHRRWLSAKYGFWPCSQMKVFPLLTCLPIDKAIGQLDSRCMWSSPRFSQYMRIASVAICCPPPVEKLIGWSKTFIHGSIVFRSMPCSSNARSDPMS